MLAPKTRAVSDGLRFIGLPVSVADVLKRCSVFCSSIPVVQTPILLNQFNEGTPYFQVALAR
jgi:hypothetical protein